MKTPVSQPAFFAPRLSAGFSLFELLIALVIAALLISLSALTFGDKRKDELETQSLRIYALLQQVKDETVLRGIDLGLRVEPTGYRFYSYNPQDNKWLPITDHDFFKEREIPNTLELKLVVDGNTLFAENEDDVDIFEEDVDIFEDNEKPPEPPQIFILSSGEMNDFKIALGWTDEDPLYYVISGNQLGDIMIDGPLAGNLQIEVTELDTDAE